MTPIRQALEALKSAREFIVNGVEFGYIRMPDADTPDSAHQTLPEIEVGISALRSHLESEEAKDAELLDWLEKVGDIAITRFRNGVGGPLLYEVENGRANTEHTGATLREAIRAALSNTQVEGGGV